MIARLRLQTLTMIALRMRAWRHVPSAGPLALMLLTALLPATAGAATAVSVAVADVSGADFAARDIRVSLTAGERGFAGTVRIGELTLPAPLGALGPVTVSCPRLTLRRNGLQCAEGRFELPWEALDTSGARLALALHTTGRVSLQLDGLGVAGGEVGFDLERSVAGVLRVSGRVRGLRAGEVPAPWRMRLDIPDGLDADGSLDVDLRATGTPGGRFDVRAAATLSETMFASADGRYAAEQLSLEIDLHLAGDPAQRLDYWLGARTIGGQAYFEPVFLDLDTRGVSAEITGYRDAAPGRLWLTRLRYRDDDAIRVVAHGELAADGEGRLEITRVEANLADAYERYAQPFLIGGPLDALAPAGSVEGRGEWVDGGLHSVSVHLREGGVDDRQQRLQLAGVAGELHWSRDAAGPVSWLAWEGGRLLRLPLGPARLELTTRGDTLTARGPQRVPVLDGALVIGDLDVSGLTDAALDVRFDAALEPVSLGQLTRALEWPLMRGTVGGSLPGMRYHERTITTGGRLRAAVFDGDIVVDNLRIEALLGPLPRLEADIVIRRLDLDAVTDTFEFGQISGRLDGEITGLRMLNWTPSAFAARVYSTPDYTGRRRISQRAIDNLSSIGTGGVGGALSGTFMGFFDDFKYAEIGLSCTLRNEVCRMGGAGPTNGGYYIVRGRGLPRINVIGGAERVAWPALMQQLASLQELDQAQIR